MSVPTSAPPPDRPVGEVIDGKYQLLRPLGRGGMGVVYEARHAVTHRRVALKILHAQQRTDPEVAARFLTEAQAAGRVTHPNVIETLDAGEDADGSLYLVLEKLRGEDLATRIVRERRLEVGETVTIVAQVLQALEAAHRGSLVHRDIKPENIFLTRSPTGETFVKILDFGISKDVGSGAAPLSVTQHNMTVGTPHYMSPEQARGVRTLDHRADLWAVGVVMYECLAGNVPFDGANYNDQIARVLTTAHVPLASLDVPRELSRVVDRALEKDATQRPASAAEMLADLRRFVAQRPEYADQIAMHHLREPAPPEPETGTSVLPPPPETPFDPTVITVNDDTDSTATTRPGGVTVGFRRPGRVPSTWIAGAVAAVVGAGVFGYALRGSPGSATPAAPMVISPPADDHVTLSLLGVPPGSAVLVDGTLVRDPTRIAIARATRPAVVEVRTPAAATARIEFVPVADNAIAVAPLLVPAPAPIAPAPVPVVDATAVTPPPSRTTAAPVSSVTVRATPGCTVLVEGRTLGRTPLVRATLSPGPHRVFCRLASGAVRSQAVNVVGGRDTVVQFAP